MEVRRGAPRSARGAGGASPRPRPAQERREWPSGCSGGRSAARGRRRRVIHVHRSVHRLVHDDGLGGGGAAAAVGGRPERRPERSAGSGDRLGGSRADCSDLRRRRPRSAGWRQAPRRWTGTSGCSGRAEVCDSRRLCASASVGSTATADRAAGDGVSTAEAVGVGECRVGRAGAGLSRAALSQVCEPFGLARGCRFVRVRHQSSEPPSVRRPLWLRRCAHRRARRRERSSKLPRARRRRARASSWAARSGRGRRRCRRHRGRGR